MFHFIHHLSRKYLIQHQLQYVQILEDLRIMVCSRTHRVQICSKSITFYLISSTVIMFQEIEALLSLFKIEMRFLEKPKSIVSYESICHCLLCFFIFQEPYWVVEFSSEEDVKLLTNRSVSLRNCLELWGQADSLELLHKKLGKIPSDTIKPYFQANKSFKIDVETFCRHFSHAEKVAKLEVRN